MSETSAHRRRAVRLLFVQTQAEMAGAQEISRLLGEGLGAYRAEGESEFEIHHLFLYRKTDGCDSFPNAHFAAPRAPRSLPEMLRFAWNTVRLIRKIRPDVLLPFQHYGNIVVGPIGRLLRVPRIIANHVSAPATIKPFVRRIDLSLGVLGFYDVMTVNSQATYNDYQQHPQRYRERIVYVPHGFATKRSTLSKADARSSFNLPHGVKLAGTVARLHPLKRIDLAIATLPLLPDVHLAVAGQGPDGERLRHVAEQAGVNDRVHFLGEMPPEKVADFLACLDVFVFPSSAETFGLAAVEAAQAGVPVIASPLPVLREVLAVEGAACAEFVDVTKPDVFAQAIHQLLTDQKRYHELSQAGQLLASRYSLEAMTEAYRRLIYGSAPKVMEVAAQGGRAGEMVR